MLLTLSKMSFLSRILSIFSNGKHKFDDADRRESASVRRLKKEINELEQIIERQDERLHRQDKDLKQFHDTKDKNKMWELAEKVLVSRSSSEPNVGIDLNEISKQLTTEQKTKVLEFLKENKGK